jgi:hypothetical protein
MNILTGCIPSFKLPYLHRGSVVDKEVDRSWLYRDEIYSQPRGERKSFPMPEKISSDFLVGIEADLGGKKYVSKRSHSDEPRKVVLQVTDFGYFGNTHKYGVLKVSGVYWSEGKYATMSNDLSMIDPRVTGIWSIDLCKIITNEDLGEKAQWDGYEPHEGTCRFSNISELYCTAAYVSLLRIEGDFALTIGTYAQVPDDDDYLVKVENDVATVFPNLQKSIDKMLETKNYGK